jgi:hypothetical protein
MPRTGLYVALDAHYQDDGKFADLSAEAELVFIRSLVLAKRSRSDGFIDGRLVRRLCEGFEAAEYDWQNVAVSLCAAALWEPTDGGYLICSWEKHNTSSEDPTNAERQRRHRERKRREEPVTRDVTEPAPSNARDVTPREEIRERSDQIKTDTRGAFESFWRIWPRRIGKPKAQTAFGQACKRTSPEEIIAGAATWAQHWGNERTDPQFIPHPTTWLNRDGWNDQPPDPAARAPVEPKGFANIRRVFADAIETSAS